MWKIIERGDKDKPFHCKKNKLAEMNFFSAGFFHPAATKTEVNFCVIICPALHILR